LVGGHCIGVDPYYLAQKAQEVGYHPEIILAGRRLNDSMGAYVANETIKHMIKKDIKVKDANILILGFTFKENCPDVRNTKVIDIIKEFDTYYVNLSVVDPWAAPMEVKHEYNIITQKELPLNTKFDAIVLAVGHNEFKEIDILSCLNPTHVIFDVKGLLDRSLVDGNL
jgi:UDP-N-acetyl-D-galactosamine dehydrogenase